MNRTITDVFSWEALDSRGNPTVAAIITLEGGHQGRAIVPAGASTGKAEAVELRDGGERYGGKGVRAAVANVNGPLAAAVRGLDAGDQRAVDAALITADRSPELSRLGANAALAVSIATAQAAAVASDLPLHQHLSGGQCGLLPLPMVNIISGGAHAGRAIDIQDFLVVPLSAHSFAEAIEIAWRVRRATTEVARGRGYDAHLAADEGGLGFSAASNREALAILADGIERAGLEPGREAGIAIDVAASEFFDPAAGVYRLATEGRELDALDLIDELVSWTESFPIISIEDILAEDDWDHWPAAHQALPDVQLIGDDLFVTHLDRLNRGIEIGAANAILVKPNQVGTLTGAYDAVQRAREAGYATVLSARSGETEDNWLSDMAVGWCTGQIKVGSTTRSERTAKWNRLLEIEARADLSFAGAEALAHSQAQSRR